MIMVLTTTPSAAAIAIQRAVKNASLPSYAPLRPMEQGKDAINANQLVLVHLKEKASQEQIAKPRDTT
jgi:hypothetical protein